MTNLQQQYYWQQQRRRQLLNYRHFMDMQQAMQGAGGAADEQKEPETHDKLKFVVETTSDSQLMSNGLLMAGNGYTKTGIYSAERDDAEKPVVIDWGDGTVEEIDGDISQKVHEYAVAGQYEVAVKNIKTFAASDSNYAWYNTASQNKYTLKEVVEMPESVTNIRNYAFDSCSSLKSVQLPTSLTSIGQYAFYNCSSLSSIQLPASLISIGYYAFGNCSSLSSIYIPKSVTSIGSSAFYNCTSLSSIEIPDSVTSISFSAFGNCRSLSSIELPASLTSIDNYAFENCTSLSSIQLPASLTSIGSWAFSNCTSLSSIQLPASLTSIGGNAFNTCSSLSNAYFEGKSLSEVQVMANYPWGISNSTAIKAALPAKVDLTMTDGSEKSIKIYNRTQLTRADLTAECNLVDVESIEVDEGINGLEDNIFLGFDNMTEIKLSNPIFTKKYVVKNAKKWKVGINADGKTHVVVIWCADESIVVIGDKDDSSDSWSDEQLTKVTYKDGSTKTFKIKGELKDNSIKNKYNAVDVKIGSAVTSIGNSAFSSCTSLSSIQLPASLTSIGRNAFANCSSLSSIQIPESVTSIGNSAFYYCTSLSSIQIPESVTSIGNGAFMDCISLSSIQLPASLTRISNSAFWGCTSLSSIQIPDSVISINSGAFYNCTSLTSITIGNSVTSIGNYAFEGCSSLSSIQIPAYVTSIGDSVFQGCTSLSSITCSRMFALTVQNSTFGTSTSNYTGRNTYDQGINRLYIPTGAIGYDSNYWADPLQNPDKCGFTLKYI